MKKLIGVIVLLLAIISALISCRGMVTSVKIQPYLEDGEKVMLLGGGGGVTFNGKYLKFKLINKTSNDYLVQFTLLTRGKIQDSEDRAPRDYGYEIPNIFVPAYANSENDFSVYNYNKKGYFKNNDFQFFGLNSDGSCLAETVEVKNVKIIKASEHPEFHKPYRHEDGRLAYDTQGAIPSNGSYK